MFSDRATIPSLVKLAKKGRICAALIWHTGASEGGFPPFFRLGAERARRNASQFSDPRGRCSTRREARRARGSRRSAPNPVSARRPTSAGGRRMRSRNDDTRPYSRQTSFGPGSPAHFQGNLEALTKDSRPAIRTQNEIQKLHPPGVRPQRSVWVLRKNSVGRYVGTMVGKTPLNLPKFK